MQTGCGLLQSSLGAGLDYAIKFTPVAQSRGARRKLAEALRSAYQSVLVEPLDGKIWELAFAPLEFGGVGIAKLSDIEAAAAYVLGDVAHIPGRGATLRGSSGNFDLRSAGL